MMRLTMIMLCFILAAAAAGRYQAEAAVRETRNELRRLDHVKSQELTSIQVLRAEVAFLESPERLASVAEKITDLEPLSGAQLMTAEDFRLAFGDGVAPEQSASSSSDRPLAVAELGPVAER
jgi:hypothetical protein